MHEKLIDRLGNFIDLEREIRRASSSKELGFVICNLSKRIISYETALFLAQKRGKIEVQTVSGTSEFEHSAPIVRLAESVVTTLPPLDSCVSLLDPTNLAQDLERRCIELGLTELVVVSLNRPDDGTATSPGALVLLRDKPWQVHEVKLLEQLCEVIEHARTSLESNNAPGKSTALFHLLKPGKLLAATALSLIAFLPIRQSIIAEGEITARSPAIVSTAVEGVIKDIAVRPNQMVKKGQILITLDSGETDHKRNKVQKELELANERLRKATQEALGRKSQKNVIAELNSEVSLKQLELDYIDETIQKFELRAADNGVVLFSSPKDWIGRAVNAGEKIMELASGEDNQFEIWVAANDAIELKKENAVKFFPNAFPLQAVKGSVETVSFFSRSTEEGVLSYRVLGNISKDSDNTRLGMKGTARIYGEKVSLAYYLFRKPLSAVRQSVGI